MIESTAFGTRVIIDAFESAGVGVAELVIAGGLMRNELIMQIYADVTKRPLSLIRSAQGPALGSAIHAAVAAGAYPDVPAAAAAMGSMHSGCLHPGPVERAHLRRAVRRVRGPARLLRRGTGDGSGSTKAHAPAHLMAPAPETNEVLHRLRALRDRVLAARAADQVLEGNRHDHAHGRRGRPGGGVPAARGPGRQRPGGMDLGQRVRPDPGREGSDDLMVIKPSGISYDDLTPESMVVCDLDGNRVDGAFRPSSDTAAHAYVYRHMPQVGGVVHTHSTYATAWAARGEAIPCVITAMADEFGGEIPVGPFALIGGDEIGRGIVATLAGHRSPAVLMRSHGVFTIGGTARARSRRP